jgi:hypothetical protein
MVSPMPAAEATAAEQATQLLFIRPPQDYAGVTDYEPSPGKQPLAADNESGQDSPARKTA